MKLSDELRDAAESLGRTLRATDVVQTYLEAQERLEADPEARSLEARLQGLYQHLLARQQAGEELSQDEVDEFYALRGQVQSHPLIAGRNFALSQLKRYFADVALDLGSQLGADFTTLARAT